MSSTQTHTLPDGTHFEMVKVEGSTFSKDSENPSLQIQVDDFYLGRYAVSQALWESIMGNNPAAFPAAQRPVENVSWYDAVEFCNQLSERLGFDSVYYIDKDTRDPNNLRESDRQKWLVTINEHANGFRLPTEIQWEYAAAGGKYKQGHEFAGGPNINEVAWYTASRSMDKYFNSEDISQLNGLKRPNLLGLFDMSGNIWEWCWDWYDDDYFGELGQEIKNPHGPPEGEYRVVRGGSWGNYVNFCRVSFRDHYPPDSRNYGLGFRLCRYESRR